MPVTLVSVKLVLIVNTYCITVSAVNITLITTSTAEANVTVPLTRPPYQFSRVSLIWYHWAWWGAKG